jgi:hypothetical protein
MINGTVLFNFAKLSEEIVIKGGVSEISLVSYFELFGEQQKQRGTASITEEVKSQIAAELINDIRSFDFIDYQMIDKPMKKKLSQTVKTELF